MTEKEIVKALQCISTVCSATDRDCLKCGYFRKWFGCDADRLSTDAADLIERLTAENAKAEAERDAALADLADARSCKTCKYACDTRDCSSCKSKTCKCRECHLDKNAWEWRGLPEESEEGEKA